MANLKHVVLLERSVDKWNKWRNDNPHIIPDLRGASFQRANLISANLSLADIRGAKFSYSQLNFADLKECKTGLTRKWRIIFFVQQIFQVYFSGKLIHGLFFTILVVVLRFFIVLYSLYIFSGLIAFSLWFLFFLKRSLFSLIIDSSKVLIQRLFFLLKSFLSICGFPVALGGKIFGFPGALCLWVVSLISGVELDFRMIFGQEILLLEPVTSAIVFILASFFSGYSGYRLVTEGKSDLVADKVSAFLFGWRGSSFREANLSDANLSQMNLDFCDFRDAVLDRVDFYGCDLSYLVKTCNQYPVIRVYQITNLVTQKITPIANYVYKTLDDARKELGDFRSLTLKAICLENADLRKTDFSNSNLSYSNLKNAQMEDCIFVDSCLVGVDMRGANLNGANLQGANLSKADLRGTNLEGCNFENANLSKVLLQGNKTLSKVNLSGAKFDFSDLGGVDLNGLDLNKMSFKYANLFRANLSRVQALGSIFDGACLTASCIEDWNINEKTSFEKLECQYIYIKKDEKERRPSSGDFKDGEFAVLFKKAIETVDLIFTDGIDWEALFGSLRNLQEDYGKERISVQSIERKGDSGFLVRLETNLESEKAIIEAKAKAHYQVELRSIEDRYKRQLFAKAKDLAFYRRQNLDLSSAIKTLSLEAQGPKTIQLIASSSSSSEAISMNSNQLKNVEVEMNINAPSTGIAGKVSGDQNIQINQASNLLVDISQEVHSILVNLSQQYPVSTTSEQMVVATKAVEEIENKPELKSRLVAVLRAGLSESLRELIDHPVINILLASIEAWKTSS